MVSSAASQEEGVLGFWDPAGWVLSGYDTLCRSRLTFKMRDEMSTAPFILSIYAKSTIHRCFALMGCLHLSVLSFCWLPCMPEDRASVEACIK